MKRILTLLPIAAVLVILTSAAVYSTFINASPHQFSDNDCFGCHFTIPQEGDPRPLRFVKPISELCGRCHRDLTDLSHISDFEVERRLPLDLPVDSAGNLTCATCHDPHRNRFDARNNKTYYLRTERRGKGFCLLCHESKDRPGEVTIFAPGGGLTHKRSMDRAHGFANFSIVSSDDKIDPLSKICMGCHSKDEEKADRGSLEEGKWTHGSGIGLSHPIGVDYAYSARVNRDLKSFRNIDPRVKFFDGRIGCCTCHNPYGAGGGHGLVIYDNGSSQGLCLACHDQ